jgi:hypothetical protein
MKPSVVSVYLSRTRYWKMKVVNSQKDLDMARGSEI